MSVYREALLSTLAVQEGEKSTTFAHQMWHENWNPGSTSLTFLQGNCVFTTIV